MLQKYFPILGEVNSPLAALQALGFTATAAKVALNGISNEVLESLLWAEVADTAAYRKEVEISTSQLEAARKAASKAVRTLRYRAACAARGARAVSKLARRIKATNRPIVKGSHRTLKGLSLDICRARAAANRSVVRAAAVQFNTAVEAVYVAIEGGDTRTIRSTVAILKASVRELEIAHLNFRFAREMLSIALARHSA